MIWLPLDLAITPLKKRIFITEAMYAGNLVSDIRCTADAAANPSLGRNWVAWISTLTSQPVNAIERVADVGPWYDLAGVKIFENKTSSQAGALSSVPLAPLLVTELGNSTAIGEPIWTGTLSGGTKGADVCFDRNVQRVWYSALPTDSGDIGRSGRTDKSWTADGRLACSMKAHIICIEQ